MLEAPTSFEQMYTEYFDYVTTLVRKFGIKLENVEDTVQTIMTKFYEKHALEDFDVNRTSEFTGRPVVFKTFVYGFVSKYVLHLRDRQNRQQLWEAFYIAEPEWFEAMGPVVEDNYDALYEAEMLSNIRAALSTTKPTSSLDRCDLPLLFEFVLEQVEAYGKINARELAEVFEVSLTTISNWMVRLRTEIAPLTV